MELGVLNDMPDIREKASFKLVKQQVILSCTIQVACYEWNNIKPYLYIQMCSNNSACYIRIFFYIFIIVDVEYFSRLAEHFIVSSCLKVCVLDLLLQKNALSFLAF